MSYGRRRGRGRERGGRRDLSHLFNPEASDCFSTSQKIPRITITPLSFSRSILNQDPWKNPDFHCLPGWVHKK